MQFTLADCSPSSTLAELFLWMMLFSALLMGPPLFWWARSHQDRRDVLNFAVPSPQRFRGSRGGARLAVIFIGPLLLAMAFAINASAALFGHRDAKIVGSVLSELIDAPFFCGAFAAMTVLVALLRVRWLQSDASHRDVLHIGTRSS